MTEGFGMTFTKLRKKSWLAIKRAFYYDTRPTEFFSICFKLWWAILLLASDAVFSSSPALMSFAVIARQIYFGSFILTIAVIHIGSIIFNFYEVRRAICIVAAMWWAFVATKLFEFNPLTPATGVYLIIAIQSAWTAARGPHDGEYIEVIFDRDAVIRG